MPEDSRPSSYWNSLAGLITAIAALVTAVGGVIAPLHRSDDRVEGPAASTRPQASVAETVTQRQTRARSEPSASARSSEPAVQSSATVSDTLANGTYGLYTYSTNDLPQKNGITLKLQQIAGNRFLAELNTPPDVGYMWSGELRRDQNLWTVTIRSYRPGNLPWAGGPDVRPGGRFNPLGSGYTITVTGPLVTFQNQTYKYVWKKMD